MTVEQYKTKDTMKTIETRETATRSYHINQDAATGLFTAHYQPKNPKTGKPWQAARSVGFKSHDAHALYNWNTGAKSGVIAKPLGEMDWTQWTSAATGFLAIETARAAIQKEIAKHAKTEARRQKEDVCKLAVEDFLPIGASEKLARVALALAMNNRLDRNGAAMAVRAAGLFAHVGGHHVAIHAADGNGNATGDRMAMIVGTGPDWE